MGNTTKLKTVSINFGAFHHSLIAVFGDWDASCEFIRKLYEDKNTRSYGEKALGKFFCRENHIPVIWMPRVPVTPEDYGTLAHEAWHAVHWVLYEWAEVKMHHANEEVCAHALGFCVAGILRQVARLKKKEVSNGRKNTRKQAKKRRAR